MKPHTSTCTLQCNPLYTESDQDLTDIDTIMVTFTLRLGGFNSIRALYGCVYIREQFLQM